MAETAKQAVHQQGQKNIESVQSEALRWASEQERQAEEAGANIMRTAGQFQEQQLRAFQQNLMRWQDAQLEAYRTGVDILFIEMDMMKQLLDCQNPSAVMGVGENALRAMQDRVMTCMGQYRDLAAREYQTVTEMPRVH